MISNHYKYFFIGIFCLFTLLVSCEKKKQPQGVLTHQEMVRVLREIYIAEDKVNRLGVTVDSSDQIFTIMKGKIAQRTGIADTTFKRSLQYYIERPKEMELIYTALVDSLNLEEQRASVGDKTE